MIAGGTGFLGTPLASALARHGHEVGVLTRRTRDLVAGHVTWNPDGNSGPWASALEGVDAIVNLAGASIAARRWTRDRKRELLDSRILATRSLVAALRSVAARPRVLVNASGVGYYGPRGDEELDERAPQGNDFLAAMSAAWEAEANHAAAAGIRLVVLRTGLVLAADGGVLGRLLLPFRLGLGGTVGDGRQYVPWIHRRDWIDLVRWSLISEGVQGTFNAAAPAPVTNREFTETLATTLRRPHIVPVPGFALRIALGEIADTLLSGQRAIPRRALDQGFHFRWPSLAPALRNLLS